MFDEPVEPNLLPKEVYSRYDALRAIDQGGMGIVYEAVDRETGAKVALKILKPDLAAGVLLDGDSLVAVRVDNNASLAFAQIDPATGKALSEFEPLWTPTPTATNVRESRMYTFTPDGLAYSLQLSAAGR